MKNQMKLIMLFVITGIVLSGCGTTKKMTQEVAAIQETTTQETTTQETAATQEINGKEVSYVDALGENIELSALEISEIRSGTCKVAVLNGSFAEIWSIAGGKLAAVTADAYDEGREISLDEAVIEVGELKSPNLELLLQEEIKIAILSADIEEHVALKGKLEEIGIIPIYFSVETFKDYKEVLALCTQISGEVDSYEKYGIEVEKVIQEQIERQDGTKPSILFIRAFSTGAKAKGSDNMTGIMLKELGCNNIADGETQLTDDLSMEVILKEDPDYIFVTTMGSDEAAAMSSVQSLLKDNPAWSSLTAVKHNHYYVLPKNMFHNKPNQRWGESYRMLADILYPEEVTE